MRKKSSENNFCVVCEKEITNPDAFVFYFNEDAHWFCDDHAKPFKMGIALGQVEINSKFMSFISDLPEELSKDELKKNIRLLAPMSKFQNSQEDQSESNYVFESNIKTPKQLYDKISETVIGQESAKKAISVSVINHLQFIDEEIHSVNQTDKHHVLMLGKSGSGKTLIANTVADLFDLPFVMGDATNYSPTGFQGADAESVIHDLLLETDMNFDLAERGIVFMDEIDKICCSNKSSGRYESFIGSTQSTLLKLVEGKTVKVPGTIFGEMPGSTLNVSSNRILFFFGGAFNGLADIVAKKMGMKDRSLGFRKENESKNKEIDEALKSYEIFSQASREELVESLIEFGMLSELVGRIPTITALKPLSKDDLLKVLLESSASPIQKQKIIFEKSGYNIQFTDEFINDLVDSSYKSAVGTRALDSYVKKAVSMASFDLLTLDKKQNNKGIVTITNTCLQDPNQYQKSKIISSAQIGTSLTF